mmetsp:Transcript_16698/g.15060  ORF Transcript_16698/g.15060 Transcript_16698/m.15060 type:complete len:103 (+) Transcript_16698:66-374(+)
MNKSINKPHNIIAMDSIVVCTRCGQTTDFATTNCPFSSEMADITKVIKYSLIIGYALLFLVLFCVIRISDKITITNNMLSQLTTDCLNGGIFGLCRALMVKR